MGIGDEIIASGHARKAFEKDGRRVVIVDKLSRPRWSSLWQGLSWIVPPGQIPPVSEVKRLKREDVQLVRNGPQCRPYIQYPFNRRIGMRYSGWRVRDNLGFIQLKEVEVAFAAEVAKQLGKFVIVEPLVKPQANPNKQWGRARWQDLANVLIREGMNPVQIGPPGTAVLQGVTLVETPDFRFGTAVMKFARWSFLPDGGLHHAAGVLGMPATVLWGGTNDPNILGYPDHENIYFPSVCGNWRPCAHCHSVWRAISPDYVWTRTLPRLRERYGENYRSR